ncbi:MAG: ABC transporter substrate-binding protein [Aminobacteriaceae bacterium]
MRVRAIATTVIAVVAALFTGAGFFLTDNRFDVPVTLFYDDADLTGAVVSKQALQSVVLAMEFFNDKSSTHRFVPIRESNLNVYQAIERASERKSAAIIGGINAPFSSLLADASRRQGIAFISMASGPSLSRPNDLVFRPRPDNGGRKLGKEAKERGAESFSVIVSGFAASHVQDFIRDFQSEIGVPPRRTISFSGDLRSHIDELDELIQGVDAVLLVLPDWLSALALRELQQRFPHIPVYLSNWAVSHRMPLLAGASGEGAVTSSYTVESWDEPGNEFVRFVANTYTSHIPRMILAMGYDTVAMLDSAVRLTGNSERDAVAEALASMDFVDTVGGAVPMDKNGDIQHRGAIFTMRSGRWVRESKAGAPSPSSR